MPVPQLPPAGPARFLGAVFGFVFGGIGLTVIIALWSVRGFDEPPLFFKLFGSFIAIAFIAAGATVFVGAFKGQLPPSGAISPEQPAAPGAGYDCPACGARLGEGADVSPKGDVKCGYCRKWFNVHG
jgi:hypothetical protein